MNLVLDFTRECNSHCRSCQIWNLYTKPILEIEYIEKLLKQIESMDVIYVTGGEPYINDNIIEIAKLVKKYHPSARWKGATNCLDPKTFDRIKAIVDMGLKVEVDVSIEGDEQTHDADRGVIGNYRKMVDLVKRLRENNIKVSALSTTQEGVAEAKRLDLNVYYSKRAKGARYSTLYYCKDVYIDNCPGAKESITCDPYGNIWPCSDYDNHTMIIGNIKEQDLKDMEFKRVISLIDFGYCKPCSQYCWSKDGLRPQ
jgi:sulfatase maturation enzyme AslB (radical SAM superfamily)